MMEHTPAVFNVPWLLSVIGRDISFGDFGVIILSLLVLAPIDFIAVLFYIITQHPKGRAKVISYAALAPITWALLQSYMYFY
jgi:hypothetical protein